MVDHGPEGTSGRRRLGGNARAERLLAIGFLAAFGVWMALAFALGAS